MIPSLDGCSDEEVWLSVWVTSKINRVLYSPSFVVLQCRRSCSFFSCQRFRAVRILQACDLVAFVLCGVQVKTFWRLVLIRFQQKMQVKCLCVLFTAIIGSVISVSVDPSNGRSIFIRSVRKTKLILELQIFWSTFNLITGVFHDNQ